MRLYNTEDMLEFLLEMKDELGRFPTEEEIDLDPDMPSASTYKRRFGDMFTAKLRAQKHKRYA